MPKAPEASHEVVPASLSDLDLLNLDKDTGEAPESRIRNVGAAVSIFTKLLDADDENSRMRAKVDAMFDGVAPYDQAVLKSTGQGARTNVNFGEAQRLLDVSLSSYVDLYTSLQRLVRIKLKKDYKGEYPKDKAEEIIADEITSMIRAWPLLDSTFLRLATEFTKHGAAFTYFDDAKRWKFRMAGLGDFLIPRQTQASEESVEVACVRFPYMLHDLYKCIRDEEAAEKAGWNVKEMKRVITVNASNSTSDTSGTTESFNWEQAQKELKNNDLNQGLENTSVSLVHMWVAEFNGSRTFLIFAKDNPKDFLYRGNSMFDKATHAYIGFTNGVGTNGTYHSVRGLGQRIFPHIQMSNRLRCQMVDSAMLAGSVMIQPESERSLNKLSYTMYGPYSVLPPQLNIVEKASPNLSQAMQPALNDVTQQLLLNADPMSAYGPQQSSPYRSDQTVDKDTAMAMRLTGSTLNLFYASWTRLLREITRRILTTDDEAKAELKRRLEARDVPVELLKFVDLESTSAVRAIGNGSPIARLSALRELSAVAGRFDDVGLNNLDRDITSHLMGHDHVDRYVAPSPEPRKTSESKIAMLENSAMQRGEAVEVMSSELHGEHLRVHAPLLQDLVASINAGQTDPIQALPIAGILHQHTLEHNAALATDPNSQSLYKSIEQLLQQSKEIIVNFGKKLERLQREQQAMAEQQMSVEQQQPPSPSPTELKYQEHQIKMQIAQEKAAQEMQIKDLKARQDMALEDAKAVNDL